MQVIVDEVKAHFPGTGDPHNAVYIGLVVVGQGAHCVGGHVLLHLGAVLHGTGPLAQVGGNVGTQYLLCQAQEVSVDPHLVDLGKGRGLLAAQNLGYSVGPMPDLFGDLLLRLGHQDAPLARYAQVKNQFLIPLRFMEG